MTHIRSERRERGKGQENDKGEKEGDSEEVEGRRKPPRIPMPKFDHDSPQDVSHFQNFSRKLVNKMAIQEVHGRWPLEWL